MRLPDKRVVRKYSQKGLTLLVQGSVEEAFKAIQPLLFQKIPFPLLDHTGQTIGKASETQLSNLFRLLDRIEATKAIGGYPIIGSALSSISDSSLDKALEKAKEFIIKGDVWYATDILGERVLGKALVNYFDQTLSFLATYSLEPSPWLRRSVGVAVHYFAKKVRHDEEKAKRLLALLSPHFEVRDIRIVKGIGWGLKTLGKYYPDLVGTFLRAQKGRKPSRLLIKKAITYLPPEKKEGVDTLTL